MPVFFLRTTNKLWTSETEWTDPPRDTNAVKEEVAVGDVTVNQDEYASKNNATSVVFEAFWIHATDGVYAKKKKKC